MLYVTSTKVGRLPRMSKLKYHFGLQMQCYPSSKQRQMIDFNADVDRFLYNRDVAIQRAQRQAQLLKLELRWRRIGQWPVGIRYVSMYWDIIRFLPYRFDWIWAKWVDKQIKDSQLKIVYPWMNKDLSDSMVPKNVHMKFRSALHMMKLVNHHWPNFHKKGYRRTYQTSCSYTGKQATTPFTGSVRFLDGHYLHVPKLGRIRVAGSQFRILKRAQRQLMRIGTVTICHHNDDHFTISLQLGSNQPFVNVQPQSLCPMEKWRLLGIDLNTENFLTTSNGRVVANPRYYRYQAHKLQKLQRSLSRKARHAKRDNRSLLQSKNYQATRLRLAKLSQHIQNARKNFAHQLSYDIIKNHDFVVTENLQSKNMLKNHALAMSISDVGWRQFITYLNYKADLYNKISIQIDPRYTTQMCHSCSFRMGTCDTKKLMLKDRVWVCPNCGQSHIRDYNASLNILARGINDYLDQTSMSQSLKTAKKHYLQLHYHLAAKMLALPLLATH